MVSGACCFEDWGVWRRYWGVDVDCVCGYCVPGVEVSGVEEIWKVVMGEGRGGWRKKRMISGRIDLHRWPCP